MSFTKWDILCDWRYAISHPVECFFHQPGPGPELWQLLVCWAVFVIAVGVTGWWLGEDK